MKLKILNGDKRNFIQELTKFLNVRKNTQSKNLFMVKRIVNDVRSNGDKAIFKYEKKMPKNIWSTKVLKNKQHFICKSKQEIKKIFFDYEIIFSLGCGSIINLLILFQGRPIGTVNILNKENHYSDKDLKKIDFLTVFLIPYFIKHQLKMDKKI